MAEVYKDEESKLMDHDFDGIKELDNPPPPWIMWVLYFTIAWSVVYMLVYHVFKVADLQDAEYANEMASVVQNAGNANTNVVAMTEEEMLAAGEKLFADKTCITCHGPVGEGNAIGPNLTDNAWIHGGSKEAIFNVIKNGVPEKGMTPYKDQITDQNIESLVVYIQKKLVGSNPPNGKAAQGDSIVN